MHAISSLLPIATTNLFFFERGELVDYVMLIVVISALAGVAWLATRWWWAVLLFFIVLPVGLTIFWWPHSTAGTAAAGWFPIVKQYSALAGSLCLVALQYFPKLRGNRWYLLIPPIILAINIAEAVARDIQCFSIHGTVDGQQIIGGPWNLLNATAGILNILAISGWAGIYVSKKGSKAIIWPDLTLGWIIAYDLWNLSYVYNCLPARAWYSGVALLASCTIPAMFRFARGAWIQYRAYTLTLWSAVVLTFPHFMHDTVFAHDSSHSETAMLVLALAALATNGWVFARHLHRVKISGRKPWRESIYAGTKAAQTD